jgi:hypothetical protein
MHKGTTPLQLSLPPGRYWIEVALDADVFSNYFSPPYDDVQFENDGAQSEALVLQPFAPGEKRRVVRYYRIDKFPDQGQTVVALFHPRGAPFDRVVALYPQEEKFQRRRFCLWCCKRHAFPLRLKRLCLTYCNEGARPFGLAITIFRCRLKSCPKGFEHG